MRLHRYSADGSLGLRGRFKIRLRCLSGTSGPVMADVFQLRAGIESALNITIQALLAIKFHFFDF